MAWAAKNLILAALLVISGAVSTLSAKWADNTKALNSANESVPFHHPYVQSAFMFTGQFLCIVAFKLHGCFKKREGTRPFTPLEVTPKLKLNPWVFLAPTLCDMLASSTIFIGLNLTYASSYQMLRGAVIIFTGVLSRIFLGRRLNTHQCVGMFTVIVGLAVVGLSDFISVSHSGYSNDDIITGDLLIVIAQLIQATQLVLEEKFLSKYDVEPSLGVGLEGLFGVTITVLLWFPLYFIYVGEPYSKSPRGVLEDAIDAFVQISNSGEILLALFFMMVSIGVLNFSGMSVTKYLGAVTRMVLDSVRTLVIWFVSLAIGWQTFSYIQLIGFVVLFLGMCIYNDVLIMPTIRRCCMKNRDSHQ